MKRVDENYAYDELEGFEALDLKSIERPGDIRLTLSLGHASLTKAAKDILYCKEFLQFFYNEEKRHLLILSSSQDARHAIRANTKTHTNRKQTDFIEKVCKYDLSMVRISFAGTQCRSRKNPIIFDLNNPIIEKRKSKKQ